MSKVWQKALSLLTRLDELPAREASYFRGRVWSNAQDVE
jgi:hypothetical protein